VTDSDDDVRISSIQLCVVRYSYIAVRDENWRKSSVFYAYSTHEEKNYKLIYWVVVLTHCQDSS